MLSNTVFLACQSARLGSEIAMRGTSRVDSDRNTRRSGSAYGSGRSSTVLITEKIAVLAPMPRARVRAATIVKAGSLRNMRRPKRMSSARFWIQRTLRASRQFCLESSTLPNSRSAA